MSDPARPSWTPVVEALLAADRRTVETLLDQWAEAHGYLAAYSDLLEPALEEMGRQWESGKPYILAQGYLGAKITESVLLKISEHYGSAGSAPRGRVVLGNIEDDFHSLGRKMVGVFLKANGWVVYDLGNDVPPSSFVDKAEETGATVIAASAMMYTTATNIANLREEIDRRLGSRVRLAVGGAVFIVRPELVQQVGGEATAKNALAAPAVIQALHDRAAEVRVGA